MLFAQIEFNETYLTKFYQQNNYFNFNFVHNFFKKSKNINIKHRIACS